MDNLITWLEAHDKLAGWAQFAGAVLALAVTYITAFAPGWRRKSQLHGTAQRLLSHGYEVIESYHRTSAHFAPFSQSLRQASLTMTAVADEISQFPVMELDNQVKAMSLARRLMTMGMLVKTVRLDLDTLADELEGRTVSPEEHVALREVIGERLALAHQLLTATEMKHPEWPAPEAG